MWWCALWWSLLFYFFSVIPSILCFSNLVMGSLFECHCVSVTKHLSFLICILNLCRGWLLYIIVPLLRFSFSLCHAGVVIYTLLNKRIDVSAMAQVLFDLTEEELQILDEFEDIEYTKSVVSPRLLVTILNPLSFPDFCDDDFGAWWNQHSSWL